MRWLFLSLLWIKCCLLRQLEQWQKLAQAYNKTTVTKFSVPKSVKRSIDSFLAKAEVLMLFLWYVLRQMTQITFHKWLMCFMQNYFKNICQKNTFNFINDQSLKKYYYKLVRFINIINTFLLIKGVNLYTFVTGPIPLQLGSALLDVYDGAPSFRPMSYDSQL